MGSDSETIELRSGCRYVRDGDWIESKDQGGSDYRLIQISNIGVGRFVETGNVRCITRETFKRLQCTDIAPGDVLVARMPEPTGRAWFVEALPQPSVTAVDVAIIRPDPAVLDGRYLAYYLNSPANLQEVQGLTTGTTRARIRRADLERLPIWAPPLKEQRRIAGILGALDDKIELNRCISQTLESMASALFKSWFVDFDPVRAKAEGRELGVPAPIADLFPDSFEETEFGQTPSGWEIDSIENVAERVAMGPFGSSIRVDTFVPDGVPVISGQHLRGVLLDDSDFNFVTIEHADRLSRSNVQRGDVVFTHAGSIGQAAYIPESARYDRYIVSQRQFYMRCDTARVSPLYVVSYFQSPEGRRRLLANTSSTGVPSISQPVSYLKQLRLALPPQPLMNAFDAVARSLYSRTAAHTRQSRELADVRNELLPHLLTGSSGILERHCAEAISGESQGGSVSTLEGCAL